MKITRVKSQIVKLPAEEPLAGGPGFYRSFFEFVTLRVETDAGIEGIGVTFFGWTLTAALKHAVDQLSELLIGEDPMRTEAVGRKLRECCGRSGTWRNIDLGLLSYRHGAVGYQRQGPRPVTRCDARRAARPRSHLCQRRSVADFAAGARRQGGPVLVEKGFKQMKMQLALPGDTDCRARSRARPANS